MVDTMAKFQNCHMYNLEQLLIIMIILEIMKFHLMKDLLNKKIFFLPAKK
jgi:hypothetical protein